jgi:hypothetical protein
VSQLRKETASKGHDGLSKVEQQVEKAEKSRLIIADQSGQPTPLQRTNQLRLSIQYHGADAFWAAVTRSKIHHKAHRRHFLAPALFNVGPGNKPAQPTPKGIFRLLPCSVLLATILCYPPSCHATAPLTCPPISHAHVVYHHGFSTPPQVHKGRPAGGRAQQRPAVPPSVPVPAQGLS